MKIILIIALLLLPSAGFALSLSPAPADQSIQYLGEIFGQVGNVLSGNASSMVGQIFYTFNYAVIILACILITYTLFSSILNTANDGEAMGKRGTIWVPIRMVLGIALLLPKAGGYSAMQALVMWIVLQGVGAADSIWTYAVHTLSSSAGTLNPTTLITSASFKSQQEVYNGAQSLLDAQTCVDAVNDVYSVANQAGSTSQNVANFSCTVQTIPNTTPAQSQVVCGGAIKNQNGGVLFSNPSACGTITPDYSAINTDYPSTTGGTTGDPGMYAAVAQALPEMLAAVQPAAQAIANDVGQKIAQPSLMPTQTIPGNAITNAVNIYQSLVGDAAQAYYMQAEQNESDGSLISGFVQKEQNQGVYLNSCPITSSPGVPGLLQSAINAWNTNRARYGTSIENYPPAFKNTNGQPYTLSQYVLVQAQQYEAMHHCTFHKKVVTSNQIENMGWFDAGSYYLLLAEESYLKSNQGVLSGKGLPGFNVTPMTPEGTHPNYQPYQEALAGYRYADSLKAFIPPGAPKWMVLASTEALDTTNPNVAVVGAMNMGMSQWTVLFDQLSGYASGKANQLQDPLIAMQRFGSLLIGDATSGFEYTGLWFENNHNNILWKSTIPIVGKLWGNSEMNAIIGSLWYLPLGMAILGMMLSAGMMLAVYMPLIPFILFTLGGLGWLIGVIEAMVAAPIVCFGIMHPHGQNEIMGKSEPAVMLMINMFMRPSLMIIGMLLGIGLIYVSLNVINTGFATVVSSVVTFGGSVSGPYMAACLMAIYGLFVSMVVQKCFSMVSVVPDSVLRWIQGGDVTRQQFGEMGQIGEQMSQKVGQGTSQISSAAGQGESQKGSNESTIAGNDKSTGQGLF